MHLTRHPLRQCRVELRRATSVELMQGATRAPPMLNEDERLGFPGRSFCVAYFCRARHKPLRPLPTKIGDRKILHA